MMKFWLLCGQIYMYRQMQNTENELYILANWQNNCYLKSGSQKAYRRQMMNPQHRTMQGQSVAKLALSLQNILFENTNWHKGIWC